MNPKFNEQEIGKFRIADKTIQSPNHVSDYLVSDDRAYVIVDSLRTGQYDGSDFQLPSDSRNVVAFDHQGNLEWFIHPVLSTGTGAHHLNFLSGTEQYVTRHTKGNVQFDPVTGDVLEVFPKNKLPIGSEHIKFSGEVYRVYEFEDGIFVSCRESEHDLYAFETDGTERWRSEAGNRRGLLSIEDGKLWEQLAANRTTDYRYQLNPETGERLSKEEIDTGLWG